MPYSKSKINALKDPSFNLIPNLVEECVQSGAYLQTNSPAKTSKIIEKYSNAEIAQFVQASEIDNLLTDNDRSLFGNDIQIALDSNGDATKIVIGNATTRDYHAIMLFIRKFISNDTE